MKNIKYLILSLFLLTCFCTNPGWSKGSNSNGELFSYVTSPSLDAKQRHYLASLKNNINIDDCSILKVNLDLLDVDALPELNLPNERRVPIVWNSREGWKGGREVYEGNLLGGAGNAFFITNGELVTASISLEKNHYRIYPLTGALHILVPQEAYSEKKCGMHNVSQSSEKHHERISEFMDERSSDNPRFLNPTVESCKIRLLFAYTSAVDDASPDILSRIRTDVNDFNLINGNSEVHFKVELACTVELGYNESNSTSPHPFVPNWTVSTDLMRFWDSNDGFMDDVHDLRNLYDADLCQLYTTFLPELGGQAMDILASEENAFCVSRWDNGVFTPIHEFGHLIGMRHDEYVDDSVAPFSFGHGFTWTGEGRNFRTIMAYDNACEDAGEICQVIAHWSNPNVNWNDNPTGISGTSNNAAVANIMVPYVSAYQSEIQNKLVFLDDVVQSGEYTNLYGELTINTNHSSVIYQSGSEGDYMASEDISLKPGFDALSGSDFRAYLDSPCEPLEDGNHIFSSKSIPDSDEDGMTSANVMLLDLNVFPNPTKSSAQITYYLSQATPAEIALYDLNGKMVQRLLPLENMEAGEHTAELDASALTPGIYFCRLVTPSEMKTVKVVVQ